MCAGAEAVDIVSCHPGQAAAMPLPRIGLLGLITLARLPGVTHSCILCGKCGLILLYKATADCILESVHNRYSLQPVLLQDAAGVPQGVAGCHARLLEDAAA